MALQMQAVAPEIPRPFEEGCKTYLEDQYRGDGYDDDGNEIEN
jgi:hypothetical protein